MFYISSRGSAASEWLAKMLSRHPQIVCFRSTRRLPPYPHGSKNYPQLHPDAFIEGLLECERATYGEKYFGSTHGYHGLKAKDACEKRGGTFSYILRHPVSRIHSAYIYYLFNGYYKKYKIRIENKDIHKKICTNLLVDEDLMDHFEFYEREAMTKKTLSSRLLGPTNTIAKKILPDKIITKLKISLSQTRVKTPDYNPLDSKTFDKSIPPDERFHAGMLFVGLIREFLNYDSILFKNCSVNQGIKMEEMVKTREYFSNHLRERVAPYLNFTDNYIDSVFSEQRFNVHRDNPLSPAKIWQSWPDGMKKVFKTYCEKYEIWTICKEFEYDVSFM